MFKVKGHSQDKFNNIADKLAKRGCSEGLSEGVILDIDFFTSVLLGSYGEYMGGYSVACMWGGMGIDRNIRSFIKWLNSLKHEALWSTSKAPRDLIHLSQANVNILGATISNVKNRNCRSWKDHKSWAFAIKLVSGCLPTIDQMVYRFPDLFSNWPCTLCQQEPETLKHLLICNSLHYLWNLGSKLVRDYAIYFTKDWEDFRWSYNVEKVFKSNILGDSSDPIQVVLRKRMAWITGLLADSDVNPLARCLGSRNKALTLTIGISNLLKLFF